jgi:hypothetical protein
MDIKIWYSKDMKQWRWTMLDTLMRKQESGQQYDLREAMKDIATTIEYLIETKEYDGQIEDE